MAREKFKKLICAHQLSNISSHQLDNKSLYCADTKTRALNLRILTHTSQSRT